MLLDFFQINYFKIYIILDKSSGFGKSPSIMTQSSNDEFQFNFSFLSILSLLSFILTYTERFSSYSFKMFSRIAVTSKPFYSNMSNRFIFMRTSSLSESMEGSRVPLSDVPVIILKSPGDLRISTIIL